MPRRTPTLSPANGQGVPVKDPVDTTPLQGGIHEPTSKVQAYRLHHDVRIIVADGGIGAFTRFIDAPGDFVSFWRNFAGLIALSLIFCFVGGSWKKIKETRFSGMMLLSGVFLGLLSGLYCLSTQYTTLANASFLIYTGPIYSTILAAIFLKEKLNIKGVLCIAAVVVGMLFIVGIVTPEGLTLDLDPKYTFGNAIAFASGVAYGLYLFFSRYREDCDSNVRSWWNFLFGSLSIVVLLVWHHFFLQPLSYTEKINGVTQFDASGQIITHAWNMFTMPGSSWVVLIAAALITGFGAFYLLTHATKRLKAGELAAISYQETIMASLLGLFMFGETMTTFQIIGGALIVCGGVAQIFFSTAAASKQGEKIEKEEEIRENLEARLDQEQEREALS